MTEPRTCTCGERPAASYDGADLVTESHEGTLHHFDGRPCRRIEGNAA